MINNVFYLSILFFMLTSSGCKPPQQSNVSHAQQFEQRLKLKNSLQAVKNLSNQWDVDQKANFIKLIQPIADKHEVSELRNLAAETLKSLEGQSEKN